MRAARLVGPGQFELVDVPTPKPGPGEVLIELEGCGLCGSNVPVWQGRPWFSYPLQPGAPGHEGWGRVAEVGEGVDGLEQGDRVAAITHHALAEYDVGTASGIAKLPESLDGVPVPGEPLGCAMNVFARSDVEPGHNVAVIGIGFLGSVITQLAAAAGARVIALSRRPFSLELAETMGARRAIALSHTDEEILEQIGELTGGRGCDRVIEATGFQRPLDLAGKLTRVRGRLVIAGFHQDGPRQVDMQLWNWRGLDVINAHERDAEVYAAGMRAGIDAIARGVLDVAPLYTHQVALGDIERAFTALDQRPERFAKALVMV